MKKSILIILINLIFRTIVWGQVNEEVIKDRIHEKIEDLQFQLEILANGQSTQQKRQVARDVAKRLFVNNGGIYTAKTYYGGTWREEQDTCIVESLGDYYRTRPKKERVDFYLNRIANNPCRTEVESATTFRVDNFYQTGPNQMECIAHVVQCFKRYRDGRLVYEDTTKKTIKCKVELIVETDHTNVSYIPKLEDIQVVDY